jgi:predicted metal-dependent phosphoesterase TrpH
MTTGSAFTRFGTADLQVHTSHGDGMADARALFERIERQTDLDVVAVTDHDDIRGALVAREVHARGNYMFEFVPGIEVTTRSGHLLALWVDEPVRSFRSLAETVATVHRMGGVAVRGRRGAYPLSRTHGGGAARGDRGPSDGGNQPGRGAAQGDRSPPACTAAGARPIDDTA